MFTARKLTLAVTFLVAVIAVLSLQAEASRNQHDYKYYTINIYGCDGTLCRHYSGGAVVTVYNSHWNDYHATPPRKFSGHPNGHPDNLRYTIRTTTNITRTDKCDGTPCPNSGSGDDD
jgi:hypothetical protein